MRPPNQGPSRPRGPRQLRQVVTVGLFAFAVSGSPELSAQSSIGAKVGIARSTLGGADDLSRLDPTFGIEVSIPLADDAEISPELVYMPRGGIEVSYVYAGDRGWRETQTVHRMGYLDLSLPAAVRFPGEGWDALVFAGPTLSRIVRGVREPEFGPYSLREQMRTLDVGFVIGAGARIGPAKLEVRFSRLTTNSELRSPERSYNLQNVSAMLGVFVR